MELSSKYNPKETQDKWLKFWKDKNVFHAKVDSGKKPFTIVIPPPNVTGILHMGHALNNTLQDILIRYKRMNGFQALWMPGTDHAGIATQNVVEKQLAKEGKKRLLVFCPAFVADCLETVYEVTVEYGDEFKALGGEHVQLVESLNDSPTWIDALEQMVVGG